jgi:hypothetical protein
MVAQVMISFLLDHSAPPAGEPPLWVGFFIFLGVLAYPTVGALVASRRPQNAVGWLLCALGFAVALGFFTQEYVHYVKGLQQGPLPGSGVAAYLSAISPGILPVSFLLLLFPDGRLPSRRWRVVGWIAGSAIALYIVYQTLKPGSPNPLGGTLSGAALHAAYVLEQAAITSAMVGALASLAMRLRRARGDERQQIKWLVYTASVMAAGAILVPLAQIFWLVVLSSVCAMPVVVGIAILKYRLYEIDLIINRTLVYGPLTATLVALYFGGIVVLQRVFVVLTGEQSTLAVVASTLIIAALFNPLRRRIQGFIDRRFYRRKYDAAKTLEAFSAKLRDETDLDALSNDLVGVVRETMQPAHVFLWLRPDTAPKGERPD